MKKKLQWQPSKQKLYGHPAVELAYPDGSTELTLASFRGEIWTFNDQYAGCIVRSPQSARKVAETLQVSSFRGLKEGSEIQFRAPNHLVPEIIKILKITRTRPAQARAANQF